MGLPEGWSNSFHCQQARKAACSWYKCFLHTWTCGKGLCMEKQWWIVKYWHWVGPYLAAERISRNWTDGALWINVLKTTTVDDRSEGKQSLNFMQTCSVFWDREQMQNGALQAKLSRMGQCKASWSHSSRAQQWNPLPFPPPLHLVSNYFLGVRINLVLIAKWTVSSH